MIKAFLFDYGGVMTNGGRGDELSARLAKVIHTTTDQASEILWSACDKYIRGTISEAELWQSIESESGVAIAPENRNIWNSQKIMQPLPQMIKLIGQLKLDGYVVGLLSNVIPNTKQLIQNNHGYDEFDFLVLSCEVGYAKPDPEIYALAMKRLHGLRPDEVVFLDDQERCLVPARELGMRTILVENPAQAIAAVTSLL